MAFDDIGVGGGAVANRYPPQQAPRYDDGYGYEQFPVPHDPYYGRQSMNPNTQMLNALLDTGLSTGQEFDNVRDMFMILIDNVKRVPNIEMTVIKSLQRDWADIVLLSECQGQEQRVLSKMKDLLFEIASLGAYGGAELRGISTIGAMMTTKQIGEQSVKYPQEPQVRKKMFGIL